MDVRERREYLSKRAHKQGKAAQSASNKIGKAPPACRVPDIRRKRGQKPRATAPSASAFRCDPARAAKGEGGGAPRARAEGAGAKGGGRKRRSRPAARRRGKGTATKHQTKSK